MGAEMLVITKDGQEATIVASSFHVWEERGWSKKEEETKAPPSPSQPPPPKPSE